MQPLRKWKSLSVEHILVPEQKGGQLHLVSDRFCITVINQGRLLLERGGSEHGIQTIDITDGAVWLTPPGQTSALHWHSLQPVEITRILLPPAAFAHFAAHEPGRRRAQALRKMPKNDPLIALLATSLVRAQNMGVEETYAETAAQFLAAHLLLPQPSESADSVGTLSLHRLATVTSYMQEHLADLVGLEDLARLVDLSRFHFIRAFTASTGQTPHQFLTRLRTDRARWLLEHSNDSVASIGQKCGYPNPKHFATAFRRGVGCSPSQYRQQTLQRSLRGRPTGRTHVSATYGRATLTGYARSNGDGTPS